MGITVLVTVLCSHSVKADLYWETVSVSTNVSQMSNATSVQKYYFTPNASRVELGGHKVYIVDYNAMELYTLDTKAKTCAEMNLGTLLGRAEVKVDKKKMGEMLVLGAMMGIQITPTDQLKTIAGYKCRKYNVRLPMVDGEYWVSQDVKGFQELRILGSKVGAKVGAVAENNPMLRQIDVVGMMSNLGGFPVYTVNHVMGGTVESTLKKVEQRALDPSLFIVPKEYTMKGN